MTDSAAAALISEIRNATAAFLEASHELRMIRQNIASLNESLTEGLGVMGDALHSMEKAVTACVAFPGDPNYRAPGVFLAQDPNRT